MLPIEMATHRDGENILSFRSIPYDRRKNKRHAKLDYVSMSVSRLKSQSYDAFRVFCHKMIGIQILIDR